VVLFSGEFLVDCAHISLSPLLIAATVTLVRLDIPEAPPVAEPPLAALPPAVPLELVIVVTLDPDIEVVPALPPE
tara:strand:+ start:211 stop:435 length:225 start_codon:yes stop_codon:yes gene_type:complete